VPLLFVICSGITKLLPPDGLDTNAEGEAKPGFEYCSWLPWISTKGAGWKGVANLTLSGMRPKAFALLTLSALKGEVSYEDNFGVDFYF
jgi:hypothetical protein